VASWITVLLRHTVFAKRVIHYIYFGVIFHKTKHHALTHVTSGTFIYYPFFHCEENINSSAFGLMTSMANVCCGDSQIAKHYLSPHFVFQPIWGWGILALYSFPNQIPHQKEPEILVGIFSPT